MAIQLNIGDVITVIRFGFETDVIIERVTKTHAIANHKNFGELKFRREVYSSPVRLPEGNFREQSFKVKNKN